ncbi:MAG: DNA/RNA non-specific endonuclease [Ruminococcus sp.]|nr:DNA/RNA non-specific endonuclease [Ruminococcus sp.]
MKKFWALITVFVCVIFSACATTETKKENITLSELPEYSGEAYVELNNNVPLFTDKDKQRTKSFEKYSKLDRLGRCGVAFANISTDIMPTEKRGSISSVRPTGWVQNKYSFISTGYVYNSCHLIGYQLTGENANERNLITGTRYMNVDGMLPFENEVAKYVTSTENHVLYRVTPIFEDDNLVASGVEMEAWSVEDKGKGVCFNVYCYNVQPGVKITYANGNNKADGTIKGKITGSAKSGGNKSNTYTYKKKSTSTASVKYILNVSSKKFHLPDCSAVTKMSEKNKKEFTGKSTDLINQGYDACSMCNP